MSNDTKPATDGDILRVAARLIRARGLAKHVLEDNDYSLCVMGALNMAHHGDHGYREDADTEVERLAGLVRVQVPDLEPSCNSRLFPNGFALADWNNEWERTPGEVIDALEEAADRADGVS